MELELVIGLEDAARLPRLPSIAKMKTGRAQNRPIHIVWHDDPVGRLAAGGLSLAKQQNAWRLERLLPGDTAWPPGGLPPLVEQATTLEALRHARPPTIMPVAAFDGRGVTLTLADETGPLTLTVLQGELRAVTTQHRVSRLQLAGPDGAVLTLALALADEVDLAVPVACLAAEALSVARGTPVVPRHVGAPELASEFSVAGAFAHVVGHLTDVILYLAPAAAVGQHDPEAVHQMRVAVRRLRSAIAMFYPAVGCPSVSQVNSGLKTLGARLGPARDWDVFVAETGAKVAAAFPDEPAVQRLLAAAERRRLGHYTALRVFLESAEFRRLGIRLAGLAGSTGWHSELDDDKHEPLAKPLVEFAAHVLARRLKRLVAAGEDIEHLDAPTLHDIRLRAKRLRYAAEIFAVLTPGKAPRRYIRRLSALQERLGTLNDGAVASSLLNELGGPSGGQRAFASGLVLGFGAAHGAAARAEIARAWDKFRHTDHFWG